MPMLARDLAARAKAIEISGVSLGMHAALTAMQMTKMLHDALAITLIAL